MIIDESLKDFSKSSEEEIFKDLKEQFEAGAKILYFNAYTEEWLYTTTPEWRPGTKYMVGE